jgi:hypothetical protein
MFEGLRPMTPTFVPLYVVDIARQRQALHERRRRVPPHVAPLIAAATGTVLTVAAAMILGLVR